MGAYIAAPTSRDRVSVCSRICGWFRAIFIGLKMAAEGVEIRLYVKVSLNLFLLYFVVLRTLTYGVILHVLGFDRGQLLSWRVRLLSPCYDDVITKKSSMHGGTCQSFRSSF